MVVSAADRRIGNKLFTFFLFLVSMSILSANITAEGNHTFLIGGKTDISTGLPDRASFSSVEVYDADRDGWMSSILAGLEEFHRKLKGYEPSNITRHWANGKNSAMVLREKIPANTTVPFHLAMSTMMVMSI